MLGIKSIRILYMLPPIKIIAVTEILMFDLIEAASIFFLIIRDSVGRC